MNKKLLNKTLELLNKMLDINSKGVTLIDESVIFKKDLIDTEIPIINAAFSGKLDGGFTTGLSIFSGESKTFKTLLGLLCLGAYLKKYDDAVAILYDSEFGTTPEYLKSLNLDISRIIHIPIEHAEHLKFDMIKRLEVLKRGDHVFFMVDSLGNVSSKKEIEDAIDEKSVADMTRAKAIRSLLRVITPYLTIKNLPCIMINHVYKSMSFIPMNIIPGGTAVMYLSDQVFIITKAQDKVATELQGYKFTINIEKSRCIKEKTKLVFNVNFKKGFNRYSGLIDFAIESGFVIKPKKGKYQKIDIITGELLTEELTLKATNTPDFWDDIINNNTFKDFVYNKLKLSNKLLDT